jgi:hypothetical protein
VVHVSLPAALSSTFGSLLTFSGGSASDLVASLKNKVESVTGASPSIQTLSLGSTALAADTSAVSAYGVVSGSTVDLTLAGAPPSVTAVVHVVLPPSLQPWSGKKLTFAFTSSSDSVATLKMKVEAQTGVGVGEQALSFGGVSMESSPASSLLSSFGVVDGSVVSLTLAVVLSGMPHSTAAVAAAAASDAAAAAAASASTAPAVAAAAAAAAAATAAAAAATSAPAAAASAAQTEGPTLCPDSNRE